MITLLVTSSGISQTVWETLSYDLQLLKQLLLNTIITITLLLTDALLSTVTVILSICNVCFFLWR